MKPDQEDKIEFEKKVTEVGNSGYILLPQPLRDQINLTKGSKAKMMLEEGPHGLYISIWNPAQQKDGGEK